MILTGVGRLGRDCELRYSTSGTAVANLAIAFNHGRKLEDGTRATQWLEAALWGKQAESLAQYLTKGTQVSVVLESPHVETFQKTDGTQAVKLVGNVINLEFVGGGQSQGAQQTQPVQQQKPQQQTQQPIDNFDAYDDDIPF
ncbi:MAG: single-stranded DNA-binding protein [Methylotenera sp.]